MPDRIAISIGDINGIGPEIVLKTLADTDISSVTPVILSHQKVIEFYADRYELSMDIHSIGSDEHIKDGQINVLETYSEDEMIINPGVLTKDNGKCAMLSVEKGIELCLANKTEALVTAPISKEGVNLAGYNIPGHTEFLADRTDCSEFMMMLVHENLRVGLASIHVPISEVPSLISEAEVFGKLKLMHETLVNDFDIPEPEIAVLGLNPHAGDGGYIGREEIDILAPVIEKARAEWMQVSDPQPADAFFGNRIYQQYDGILAMYHDQGLIPFKTLSFGSGVNFTAGLPIIRTSPDHGTAFDIAGQNKADPSSFKQALQLARKLIQHKKKQPNEV